MVIFICLLFSLLCIHARPCSCESMTSVRSSSGVSSTNSLLHSISDLETTAEQPGRSHSESIPSCPNSPRLLPDVRIAVSEPDPDDEQDNEQEEEEDYLCVGPPSGTDNLGFQDSFDEDPHIATTSAMGAKESHRHTKTSPLTVNHSPRREKEPESCTTQGSPGTHRVRGTGGAQSTMGSRSTSSNPLELLDFILTDSSMEASYVHLSYLWLVSLETKSIWLT